MKKFMRSFIAIIFMIAIFTGCGSDPVSVDKEKPVPVVKKVAITAIITDTTGIPAGAVVGVTFAVNVDIDNVSHIEKWIKPGEVLEITGDAVGKEIHITPWVTVTVNGMPHTVGSNPLRAEMLAKALPDTNKASFQIIVYD